MKSSDITLSIVIIIVFVLLFMVNILSVGIKNIEDNWPTYRCNPVVMPFASIFNQDPVSNFTYCIQTMQSNYMDYLLQPVNYNLSSVGNIGSVITEAVNSARAFINNLRNFITDIIKNVFGVFLNILIEFQRIMVDIKDMIAKLVGVLATLMYTIEGSMYTMQSTWNGPPGSLVRALSGLCFDPNTEVICKNGEKYDMKDLPLGSELENGAIVHSVMRISNRKSDGSPREQMYHVMTNDGVIEVSGTHLIYKSELDGFITVKELSETSPEMCILTDNSPIELSCLITSNHTIPIKGMIFHDWEDNNGSKAKTLEL